VRRVGAANATPVDVRILAATNRDLDQEVLRGTFRKDLFFRLNGFLLTVPPLRERTEEIEALARHYVLHFGQEVGKKIEPAFTAEAIAHLKAHRWPGNVRELRNVVQRAVLLCGEGPIGIEHLPPFEVTGTHGGETDHLSPTVAIDAGKTNRFAHPLGLGDEKRREIETLEQKRIHAALEECAGNQTRAAKLLGISRRSLVMKLTKYGMPRPRKQ